jgi:hypothetical protein
VEKVIVQLVEALSYKLEGRGFKSRGGHCFFFNVPIPSSRIMTLVSTRPVTEMSARNLSGGKEGPLRKADNLTTICQPIV